MYCFEDRGGESLTLRPEGTAGVVRSFISEGMQQNLPVKLYYSGPMFRYERPQKGRQRQFTQFGCELLGVETPQADIEVIAMAYEFLEKLGLTGSVTVEINSLGDKESRDAYREKLVAYLKSRYDELSEDSKTRLERNPLRVLDSKEECDKAVVEGAPLYKDSLNEASAAFFNAVLKGLDNLGIKYKVNDRWCAAWTIIRTLFSNWLPISSVRRGRCWPAAVMTAWSNRWAAVRLPASAGPAASSA